MSQTDLTSAGNAPREDEWMEDLREAERPQDLGMLGSYKLQREIGRGGQGIVYLAEDDTGKCVALKRLLAGSIAGPRHRLRFEREVIATQSLDHPGIVKVLGMVELEHQPVIVMEWVEGQDIRRWAISGEQGPRSREEIVSMGIKVSEAIAHAHRRGVIHRDLKPSNILVDNEGQPRLLDFGLARLENLEDMDPVTLSSEFLGTPAYASPEQVKGLGNEVDTRTDIYSLGVILYELLTGHLPFPNDRGIRALLSAIEETEAPRPKLQRELDVILLSTLAKDPEQRYSSMEALNADLRHWLLGEPISAHAPSASYLVRQLLRRHRRAVISVIAVVVALASLTAFAMWKERQAARERDDAIRSRQLTEEARKEAEAQRQAAVREAERMARFMKFFDQDYLAPVFPTLAGRDFTIFESLGQAAPKLETRFQDDPKSHSELAVILGKAYLGLAMPKEALGLLRRAEELTAEFSPTAQFSARLRLQLGRAFALAGRHEDALGYLNQARPNLTQAKDQEQITYRFLLHELTASSLKHLNQVAEAQTEIDAMKQLIDQEAVVGDGARVSWLRANAGLALSMNRLGEAEKHSREEVRLLRELAGEKHPAFAGALVTRSSIFYGLGKYADAKRCLEKAVALRKESLGDWHLLVAEAQAQLAQAYIHEEQPEQALAMLTEAITIQIKNLGPHNFGLSNSYNTQASIYSNLNQPEAAIRVYRKALEITRLHLPPGHPTHFEIMANMVPALEGAANRSDNAEAKALLRAEADAAARQCLAVQRQIYVAGANPGKLIFALNTSAKVLSNDPTTQVESETYYLEAIELGRRATRIPIEGRIGVMINLAGLLASCHRLEESLKWVEEGIRIAQQHTTSEGHQDFRKLRRLRLERLRALDRPEAEIKAGREWVLACQNESPPVKASIHQYALWHLAKTLTHQGQYKEAESILLGIWENRPQKLINQIAIAQGLSRLYEAWGREGKHKEWEKRSQKLAEEPPLLEGAIQ